MTRFGNVEQSWAGSLDIESVALVDPLLLYGCNHSAAELKPGTPASPARPPSKQAGEMADGSGVVTTQTNQMAPDTR